MHSNTQFCCCCVHLIHVLEWTISNRTNFCFTTTKHLYTECSSNWKGIPNEQQNQQYGKPFFISFNSLESIIYLNLWKGKMAKRRWIAAEKKNKCNLWKQTKPKVSTTYNKQQKRFERIWKDKKKNRHTNEQLGRQNLWRKLKYLNQINGQITKSVCVHSNFVWQM